jgi:hypothetical protein
MRRVRQSWPGFVPAIHVLLAVGLPGWLDELTDTLSAWYLPMVSTKSEGGGS